MYGEGHAVLISRGESPIYFAQLFRFRPWLVKPITELMCFALKSGGASCYWWKSIFSNPRHRNAPMMWSYAISGLQGQILQLLRPWWDAIFGKRGLSPLEKTQASQIMASTTTRHHRKLVDPTENQSVKIITICVVFSFLSLISIIARLLSRRIKRAAFGVDDALLVAAWVPTNLLLGLTEN